MAADIRIWLYDRAGNAIGELSRDAGSLLSMSRTYEVNGEHSMSISTARRLDVGTYALTHMDDTWEEWAIDEIEEVHGDGEHAVCDYHLVWSLQYDLQGVCGSLTRPRQPGMQLTAKGKRTLCKADEALKWVLDGTKRWEVGTCDVTRKSAAVMFQDSGWDRLNAVVKGWGGETLAEITVGRNGVTSRKLCLRKHIGSKQATRRLEWGHELTEIHRTADAGPYFCRVVPLGSSEEGTEYADDDVTEIDWKIDISEVNGGSRVLRDADAEKVFRVADGHGGWEYPTTIVSYSTDDPEELLRLAREELHDHTRPSVSYSGRARDFKLAGLDTDGISLGDEVQVVDHGFNPDAGLRVTSRVLRMEVDDMTGEVSLSIGKLSPTIESMMATITESVGADATGSKRKRNERKTSKVSVPTRPYYTIDTPGTGTVPSVPTVSDLASRVAALETGGVTMGDGWTHQIDGVTKDSGTVNFVTDGTEGDDSVEDVIEAAESVFAHLSDEMLGGASDRLGEMWGSGS